MEWDANPENIKNLKLHLSQFFAVTTGGPDVYTGKDIRSAHTNMHITNPEFDAAIGDLKATLDKLQIANQEQKELLAVVETTREQIVEER
jgi:hemoglobin